jgi:hypothetical protein
MTNNLKTLRRKQSEAEQLVGFRVGPDGSIEVLTAAETDNLVRRAMRDAMAASFRVERTGRRLH